MEEHEACLRTAVHLALAQPARPFVALLIDRTTGETLASGLNRTSENPVLHGEVDCIQNAAQTHTGLDWSNTRLYSTAEPCCMCQAAILWAGIPEVIYGTSIATLRRLGWNQFAYTAEDVCNAATFAKCRLIGGVLEQECDALFTVATELRER